MTFDPETDEMIVCDAVPISRLRATMKVRPCSAIDDRGREKLEDSEARRRRKVIDDSFQEWQRIGVQLLRTNPTLTWRSWTNAALGQESFALLTPSEIRERGG